MLKSSGYENMLQDVPKVIIVVSQFNETISLRSLREQSEWFWYQNIAPALVYILVLQPFF